MLTAFVHHRKHRLGPRSRHGALEKFFFGDNYPALTLGEAATRAADPALASPHAAPLPAPRPRNGTPGERRGLTTRRVSPGSRPARGVTAARSAGLQFSALVVADSGLAGREDHARGAVVVQLPCVVTRQRQNRHARDPELRRRAGDTRPDVQRKFQRLGSGDFRHRRRAGPALRLADRRCGVAQPLERRPVGMAQVDREQHLGRDDRRRVGRGPGTARR